MTHLTVPVLIAVLAAFGQAFDPETIAEFAKLQEIAQEQAECDGQLFERRKETLNDTEMVADWKNWWGGQHEKIKELGWNGFPFGDATFYCPTGIPYGPRPTSIHELHPSDIDLVAGIGSSHMTGVNMDCMNVSCLFTQQSPNSAFISGMNGTLSKQVTIAHIIQRFNRHMRVVTTDRPLPSTNRAQYAASHAAKLNLCSDLPSQAWQLVAEMRQQPLSEEKWKLITVAIACRELECTCTYTGEDSIDLVNRLVGYVNDTLSILKTNLPRTFVNLVPLTRRSLWISLWSESQFCKQWTSECFSSADWQTAMQQFDISLKQLLDQYTYADSKDFAAVIQPIFNSAVHARPDAPMLTPDCEHMTRAAHSLVARSLWNSMLAPVGFKQSFDGRLTPLECPQGKCPFLATTQNANDCATRMKARFGNIDFQKGAMSFAAYVDDSTMSRASTLLITISSIICLVGAKFL